MKKAPCPLTMPPELIEPHTGDKRHLERDERRHLKEEMDVGGAKTQAKTGEADRGVRVAGR